MSALLKVKNISLRYGKKPSTLAIHDLSFTLQENSSLGVVGESGCGKSSLAYSLMNLLPAGARISDGEVFFKEHNLSTISKDDLQKIRGKDISMIFQDPMSSLNPYMRIEKQLTELFSIHTNLNYKEALEQVHAMLSYVGLKDTERICRSYPHELSGGMCQRVMIAMALLLKPDLLIADEPTTALDVTTQAQILQLIKNIQKEKNASLVLISHDLGIVSEMCEYTAVMYGGSIVEYGPSDKILRQPAHPYTQALLDSRPRLVGSRGAQLPSIPGTPPKLQEVPTICSYYNRCAKASPKCQGPFPRLEKLEENHLSRCYLNNEGA
ncbi:MAG: ABC transporter ATP-binding protein [Planctomycetes bacterium]|nr:ABC transporter ATP-binding protein [Planctomycetota bacterium]